MADGNIKISVYDLQEVKDKLDALIARNKELEDALKEIVDGYRFGRYPDSIRAAAKVLGITEPMWVREEK